jgi:hypothetical protein
MDRRILLAAVALVAAANGASAADLAVHSPLGALFAEPAAAPGAVYVASTQGYPAIYAPPVDIRPLVAGYYGKPDSYIYSPYYGDSLYWNFARLPYACGFHGYC